MTSVTAVMSMLHEPVAPNSARRTFRQQAALGWTLQRLAMARNLSSMAILCWEDQLQDVAPLAADHQAHVLTKGPRMTIPSIEAVAASRRWADGWRGGLMSTCDFDLGFHAAWTKQIIEKLVSDAVVLVDPAAGLVDPKIIDHLIEHARAHENAELCFSQAAPGLGGALLRSALIERLAVAGSHPGRLLHYLPDQPMRDPISGEGCVAVPTPVARTTRNFRLDSERQIDRLSEAAIDLNGQLVTSDAEDLLNRMIWTRQVDPLPREAVLELNTDRATSPIFWPGRHHPIHRPAMTIELAGQVIAQLAAADDVRLTLAGVGDPLLHDGVFEIIELARTSGIAAIHVETDLLPPDSAAVERLAESGVDVVSVHLPAMTPATYSSMMGVDRLGEAIENIRRFVLHRHQRGRGVPILVPRFVKCSGNLAEMETWYDQWLRALGAATIEGPSDFSGLIPDCAVADMAPRRRIACSRLWSRMTILSDGKAVTCEQDVLARQTIGDAAQQSLRDIWENGAGPIRQAHTANCWAAKFACANCREWHRP